jgi:galacturonokinase
MPGPPLRNEPPIHPPPAEAENVTALAVHLAQNPAVDPATIRVVKTPLRICPLGAHVDHQQGQVTGMTIDRSILLAFAPTDDGVVRMESLDFEPPTSFKLNQVPPAGKGDWANYLRGAVLALQQYYQLSRGLVGVVSGTMPIGGLSSSAAVTIAYLSALETSNRLVLSARRKVSLVRFTENQYIGLNNGILDQSVILYSQRNHLTGLDCQSFEIDIVESPLPHGNFDILIVYCGLSRVLAGTSYNQRVAECREAAELLLTYAGQKTGPRPPLRRVDPEIFETEGHRLPATLARRARHFFGEMERVRQGTAAWRAGDLVRFGELVSTSGESSIKNYESGSPQLITLYEILASTPGVYGARFSGGGFGGCCLALIDPVAREAVAEAVHRHYPAAHPVAATNYSIHFCQTGAQPEFRQVTWPN